MADGSYQVPDLTTVLQTLAGLVQQDGSRTTAQVIHPAGSDASRKQVAHSSLPAATREVKKTIDPTTIIDWSTGLRCVMRTVATRENTLQEIRRMIKTQHDHERQWWQLRQELIESQAKRVEEQKRLNSILERFGGDTVTGDAVTEDKLVSELKNYDLKIYRAQVQMDKEMTIKLRNLGVPFFGTRMELIRMPDNDPGSDTRSDGRKTISEKELIELQRRILQILQDLIQE